LDLGSELKPLPSEAEITKARKEGDKKIKGLSADQIRSLRIQCKWDLFFLCNGPLGYDKLDPGFHGNMCAWIEANRNWLYTLLLVPRSHFKSTIQTIGESVQTALPDDSGNAEYPYNLGPDVRILIAHDIQLMAQLFLRSITQHFTTNPLMVALFPELVPQFKIQKVSSSELELPRNAVWNESTFDTMGVGASRQGNHHNIIKLDDIYGAAARDSKADRESHIQWFDNVQSFLISPASDFLRIAGTRWAFDDVYAHAMEVYNDPTVGKNQLKTYIKSVWKKDKEGKTLKDEEGREIPIFPAKFENGRIVAGFTWDSLQLLKKNQKVWNAQYINDPKEGAAAFQPEWKRFYTQKGRTLEIHQAKTPFNDAVIEEISYEELDRVILVDPATTGESGIVVTGMDRHKRVFVLECYKGVLMPEDLRDKIFSLVMKYNPRIVCVEEVIFSALFEVWFRSEMQLRGIKFKVEGVRTRQQEKTIRILALANWFSSNSIYFKQDPQDKMMAMLVREYDEFGASDSVHMLDAMAYGARKLKDGSPVWKPGGGFRKATGNSNINSSDKRDSITGYSRIRK
jgi:hypothetical protein